MDLETYEARMSDLQSLMRARSERNQRARLAAITGNWNELSRITEELIAGTSGETGGEAPSTPGDGGMGVDPPGNEGGG